MKNTPKKILTPAEEVFYNVLKEALGNELNINPKIKLSDVVYLDDSITKALSLGITFNQWKSVFDSVTRPKHGISVARVRHLPFA